MQPLKRKHWLLLDASTRFKQASLNSCLLQGPDQNNALRGILLCFRHGSVGFMTDVDSMFHAFAVDKPHKDFMRLFSFEDNNPSMGLAQFRAMTHILGCRSSPVVAIFALRFVASCIPLSPPAASFINDSFYVEDGLGSADSPG